MRGVTFNAWARAGRPLSERIAAITEALAALEALPDGPERDEAVALINIYRAIAEIDRGRPDAARDSIDAYVAIFAASGDLDGVHDGLFRRASTDVFDGNITDGLDAMGRAAASAGRPARNRRASAPTATPRCGPLGRCGTARRRRTSAKGCATPTTSNSRFAVI